MIFDFSNKINYCKPEIVQNAVGLLMLSSIVTELHNRVTDPDSASRRINASKSKIIIILLLMTETQDDKIT